MRLMSLLKKMVYKDAEPKSIDCVHEVHVKIHNFDLICYLFTEGTVGYRDIGIQLYSNSLSKMTKDIFDPLKELSKNGCEFPNTMIRFYNYTGQLKIDIPLEVFSVKGKNDISKYKNRPWYKENLKTIKTFNNIHYKQNNKLV